MRARSLLRLALCVSVVTVALPPPSALAKRRSKTARVKRYKARAFRHFAKGRYAKGIEQMRKAHGLLPHPGFLLNIAVAYDQWGEHCGEALDTFDEFFEACPDCELRDKAAAKREQVRARCPAATRIETSPPGATLTVDGAPVGESPKTLELSPGPHAIEAARPGFVPARRRVEVRYGVENTVALTLEAVPPPPPPKVTATPPPPPPTVTGQLAPIPDAPTDLTPWAWTAFGVAAAGAAAGTVFTLQTMSALDAEEQARIERRTKREVEDLQGDAVNKAIVANVGFGVAAAGLVTGVVLLILDEDPPEEGDTAWAPTFGPGGVGVVTRF